MSDYIPKIMKEGAELTSPSLIASVILTNNTINQQEATRQSHEADREFAETQRDSAEAARASDELVRESNEEDRIADETIRKDYYNAYKVLDNYNSSTSYIIANKVTYQGGTYQCITNTTGNSPTYNTDNTWWKCIAAKGTDGAGGDMFKSTYDPNNKNTDAFNSANQTYNNTTSGLAATNTQAAIDELKSGLNAIYVNVKDFGAMGDGVHDDAGAIQDAIDYLASNGGGTVKLPADTYYITTPLLITSYNINIVGDGQYQSFIKSDLNITEFIKIGTYDFDIDGTFTSDDWVYFYNIENIGFTSTYSGSDIASVGIRLRAAQFANIDRCRFLNLYDGIYIHEKSHHNKFTRNTFTVKNYGMHIESKGDDPNYNSTGNIISLNSFNGSKEGIHMGGVAFGDLLISNNHFISNTARGIYALPATTYYYSSKIGIYNNDFDGPTPNDIYLTNCRCINITNNNLAPDVTGGSGIALVGCNTMNVSQNTVTHGLKGIEIYNSTNIIVEANHALQIINNALILTGCNDIIVDDNIMYSTANCVIISSDTHNVKLGTNKFNSVNARDISSSFDPTNIVNDNGNIYTRDPSSYIGEFKKIIKVPTISSNSTYTNVARIDINTYSGAFVDIEFTLLVQGVSAATRLMRINLHRNDTSITSTSISDNAYGAVFDVNINTTNAAYVLIGVKLNTAGGTSLAGTAVIKAVGTLTSLIQSV